ncbi:calcium-binding protein, partial [Rhodosalinus halophilus]
GADTLWGAQGDDTFVFAASHGADVVADFEAGDDERIDLSAIAEIVDFTDLVANHLADVGGTAQIQSSQGT